MGGAPAVAGSPHVIAAAASPAALCRSSSEAIGRPVGISLITKSFSLIKNARSSRYRKIQKCENGCAAVNGGRQPEGQPGARKVMNDGGWVSEE